MLADTFQEGGFAVTTASNGLEAIEHIQKESFDVVITDLNMPGKNGLEVLQEARGYSPDTQVIVVTAYGTIDVAVEAMRLGAHDFVTKPFKLAEIELKVNKIVRKKDGARGSESTPKAPAWSRYILGKSGQTKQLLKMVGKIGASRGTVLITGPTGTGKELVARAIHDASPRKDRPFVALNCAALAPGTLESELFGHEKGAFTGAAAQRTGRFERAHTGTLFLDEVGEIDPGIQVKLLRVLQDGEFERVGGVEPIKVDVRIVAATNRDLREAIEQGRFREDFYYRLNVFSLRVPALSERPDDIPALVDHFLGRFSAEAGKKVTAINDEVMHLFMHYPWPGNVRELENVLERAVVLAEGEVVTREEVPQEMLFEQTATPSEPVKSTSGSLAESTEQLESQIIREALERFRWNKTKTAEHLGIKRTTLQYKIKKYELE